ncbi:leucine-rich repeat-containing protein 27-like [Stegostoma tigrinum]|uniref:leucine-rich repeat-containing protein 27-like n=1 Tax=Stegostoma tigrinum TaxID=3053191 RepID=UPI00202B9049|nr:leucine-rich repeat-containing protein 27-like [Stegostoma tigrinum]
MKTSLEQPVVRSRSGRIPEARHFCTPITDHGEAASGESHDVWCSDKSLDLCRKDVTCLRCDMPRYIEHLYLEGNLLQELPGELFEHLPQLVWLDLRKNRLQKLPARIGTHRCLRTLLLETNPLIELPLELGNVLSLKALNLRNCPLQFPPLDIVHLGTQIILSFLRQQAAQFVSENQNQETDPIHPIKMVKQPLKIITIKDSLENCSVKQSEEKLQKAIEPLMTVQGCTFCCKPLPKPVLCGKTNMNRNNFSQRHSNDRKQDFEIKAKIKGQNGTLQQRRKVAGKMFPVLPKLVEDQNYPQKIQRKKKELKNPNIQRDKEEFEQLPLQKNEDKLKSDMEENIQKNPDEEKVKEPKISRRQDFELKLQHRIQQHQQLRKKRKRAKKAVSLEDASAEVENLRKALSRLKMERQSPMEYRLCAFIGEYQS